MNFIAKIRHVNSMSTEPLDTPGWRLVSIQYSYKYAHADTNRKIYRGYSNFLLNMAFISPSEVENIYIS